MCNLILRPPKFGKTVNLSMLRYFLSDSVEEELRGNLFRGLRVMKSAEFCRRHMGQYRSIFLCFKQCQGNNWLEVRKRIAGQLAEALVGFSDALSVVLPSKNRPVLVIR
jgi:hypothetical protein